MNLFQVEIHLSSFSPSSDGKPNSMLAWLALSLLAIGILLALSILLLAVSLIGTI